MVRYEEEEERMSHKLYNQLLTVLLNVGDFFSVTKEKKVTQPLDPL